MKRLLFVWGLMALLATSFALDSAEVTAVKSELPQPGEWDYIGERNGVKFYWKITSPSEGKLKAENNTNQKLYVQCDYELLDAAGNVVKEGKGMFSNVSAHDYSTHPMTDWSNKSLKRAVRIEMKNITVKVPY